MEHISDSSSANGDRPFPESLCWRCAHHREIGGARSVFVMCEALPVKYPRQPVGLFGVPTVELYRTSTNPVSGRRVPSSPVPR
jgi:hypothetical protein